MPESFFRRCRHRRSGCRCCRHRGRRRCFRRRPAGQPAGRSSNQEGPISIATIIQ